MQIVDLSSPYRFNTPLTIALGYFDSIHVGHQTLIARAKSYGDKVGVFTFFGDFYGALKQDVKPLFDWNARMERLARLGVDCVLFLPADPKWLSLTGEEFLGLMPQAKRFVAGTDFRFGAGAKCGVDDLKAYCEAHGIASSVVDLTSIDGCKVSTRYLREYLERGDIMALNDCLPWPYSLHGRVVRGKGLGRKLDLPTANFVPDPALATPATGVYAAWVQVGKERYRAVCNFGPQPTVNGDGIVCEACILGYRGDLYGADLNVYLYDRLRDIRKFDTVEDLRKQVQADIEITKEMVKL